MSEIFKDMKTYNLYYICFQDQNLSREGIIGRKNITRFSDWRNISKWPVITKAIFLSVNQKRWIFTHLPSTKLQTVFSSYSLIFFSFKNFGSRIPTHPLHTFPIFGPPTFWCWLQSARELLRGRKICMSSFSSTLSLFLEIEISHTLS